MIRPVMRPDAPSDDGASPSIPIGEKKPWISLGFFLFSDKLGLAERWGFLFLFVALR